MLDIPQVIPAGGPFQFDEGWRDAHEPQERARGNLEYLTSQHYRVESVTNGVPRCTDGRSRRVCQITLRW